ncbi:sensor histidine kinase [Alkalimarinus sediminis]|uniref:HAMP domain-containing histidine kinase n=1 Tax=Alkalimarinus sediminis TaxID=1632866 RepID=A0A9E8HJQ3_9ALTE|nr:HAMP domain-containing sensor histidine kinase [Alkalimarinus sediminis]UZW75669.1 HAMP domain-containing histidine kinase [Alkalimarinus sediminis]
MTEDPSKPDFSMVMASSVHDMKNSLSMLLHSLELISDELPEEMKKSGKVATLQYEAERVNNDLIQLLGVYRLENDKLSVHIDEHYIRDFLEEQAARYEVLLNSRSISLIIECEDDLVGYFDRDMTAGIINNTLTNAARYTRDKIKLKAYHDGRHTVFEISDNGAGYPASMCNAPGQIFKGIDFESGSTSLGLYFAYQVAKLHKQGDETGSIELENGGDLGGGVFRIRLP